jgi:glycosyltransferase involved in cell wall biosynthesis
MRTILIAAIRGFGLVQSRLPLIQRFQENGWRVVLATVQDEYTPRLGATGAILEEIPFRRGGLSPLVDSRAFFGLVRLYQRYQPQLVHLFHAKPTILGGLAHYTSQKSTLVNTITGLGHAFIVSGSTRSLSAGGYRAALRQSKAVIFQNPDDLQLFTGQGWVRPAQAHLIIGSGVDIEKYYPSSEEAPAQDRHRTIPAPVSGMGAPRILMATRLLWQKGVREYVEAARLVRQQIPSARFDLAGEWDPQHPDAVDQGWISQAVQLGQINFLGYLDDLPEQLRATDLFILPSYREGVPRVLMEAAASGVAVIATDAPGCREAVRHGETGLLVAPQDSQALADAILDLLRQPARLRQMGQAGRQMAVAQFDIQAITEQYFSLYQKLGLFSPNPNR